MYRSFFLLIVVISMFNILGYVFPFIKPIIFICDIFITAFGIMGFIFFRKGFDDL